MFDSRFAPTAPTAPTYMFFEVSAVDAKPLFAPAKMRARIYRGYGGVGARAEVGAQHLSPAKKRGRFTAKTSCLFFRLAQL